MDKKAFVSSHPHFHPHVEKAQGLSHTECTGISPITWVQGSLCSSKNTPRTKLPYSLRAPQKQRTPRGDVLRWTVEKLPVFSLFVPCLSVPQRTEKQLFHNPFLFLHLSLKPLRVCSKPREGETFLIYQAFLQRCSLHKLVEPPSLRLQFKSRNKILWPHSSV